jgi:hypothetical protein
MSGSGSGGVRTLHHIVRAIGGDLYAGGRRANVPAPGHAAADRSISLLARHDGRLVAHSFGATPWQAALDDLRARGLIDAENRLVGSHAAAFAGPRDTGPAEIERREAARRLWNEAGLLALGTPAARHCGARGVSAAALGSPALRAHAAVPRAIYRTTGPRHPALLAAAHAPDGRLTAVEVTYLTWDGRRRRIALPRKLIGVFPPGAAVRLFPAAPEMLVAEGVFTTLSAAERFGAPGWALLSATNLARWTPPPGVRRVVIAGDPGAAGEAAAYALLARLRGAGLTADVRLPPDPFDDWNALQQAET